MTEAEAREQIYLIASGLATFANSSGGLPGFYVSAHLQEQGRRLQEALQVYEFVRVNPVSGLVEA